MSDLARSLQFLGFDVYGTVVDWRTGIARAARPFLERHAIRVGSEVFADEWRARYGPAMERVRSGERSWVKLEVLDRENLEAVLASHGADVAAIPPGELEDLAEAWRRLDPWPDALEGLGRLKRRFAIGPISNGSIGGMLALAKFGGLPWDVILGSEIARGFKPSPHVYLRSAEAAGVPPERVALVAAHNYDLEAVRPLGFRTIFVRRPHEHGPQQSTDVEPSQPWDVIADSLIGVAGMLGR